MDNVLNLTLILIGRSYFLVKQARSFNLLGSKLGEKRIITEPRSYISPDLRRRHVGNTYYLMFLDL